MIVGIVVEVVTAEMIVTVRMATTTVMNKRATTMDWIGDRKMRGIAGHSTQITPAILEKETPLIVKVSVEAMHRVIARAIILVGGNLRV